MKTSRHTLPGGILALSLLLAAGCSKERPANSASAQPGTAPAPAAPPSPASPALPASQPATVSQPALATTPALPLPADPCAEMKAALDRATLEQHDGLAGIQQRMDQDIDAQVAAKKAAADVSLAADEKLDSATEDFAEKLRMLSVARPETWNSAKHNAELALQNVRAAYADVMNSPPRR
jgi:hypothetical protein